MINVCAKYCGSTVLLGQFETEIEANEFMKHDYVIVYKDEFIDAEEDDVVHPDEMFIEDELPFFENVATETFEWSDELPF